MSRLPLEYLRHIADELEFLAGIYAENDEDQPPRAQRTQRGKTLKAFGGSAPLCELGDLCERPFWK